MSTRVGVEELPVKEGDDVVDSSQKKTERYLPPPYAQIGQQ